jgi:beta-N-acetylhexosaminidase
VRGVGDGLFEPGRATTRGQAASALAVALETTGTALPSDPPDAFDDDETSPHEAAANQLAALGLVRGTGPRAFSPDAPVTRGQTAALLVRAQEGSSGEQLPPGGDRFTDDDDSLHEPAIEKAAEAGFMGGRGYRSFEPDGALPRRQLASVLVRWVDPRV